MSVTVLIHVDGCCLPGLFTIFVKGILTHCTSLTYAKLKMNSLVTEKGSTYVFHKVLYCPIEKWLREVDDEVLIQNYDTTMRDIQRSKDHLVHVLH